MGRLGISCNVLSNGIKGKWNKNEMKWLQRPSLLKWTNNYNFGIFA